MNRAARSKKPKIKQVQSGIALSAYDAASGKPSAEKESFLTSRTARVLLAGAGFLADAYDLFVINLVLRLLKDEYPQYAAAGNLHYLEGSVASAALVGSMLGQIVAGSLADVLGRKKIFIATAALIIIGSFGSACSVDTPMLTIYGQICCWRFFLGTGVGGEYPLAATVTSESSSAGKRGSLMAAVFAMQGVGSLLSGIVVICCLYFGMSTAFTWRFALAFGAIPPLIAFPYRMRMHETETFERVRKERQAALIHHSMNENPISHHNPRDYGTSHSNETSGLIHNTMNANQGNFVQLPNGNMFYHEVPSNTASSTSTIAPPAAAGIQEHQSSYDHYHDIRSRASSTSSLLNHHLPASHAPPPPPPPPHTHWAELTKAFTYYRWHMLGTALTWFLLDVDFYANGLFNHEVTAIILTSGKGSTALQDACNSVFISMVSIPGYLLSVLYMDRVGRKRVQMMGFSAMAGLFFICGFGFDFLLGPSAGRTGQYAFLLIYSLTFLFSNFGPNTTTFVIPGEIYPTEVRATCHGLSAASGKLGAATGAYFFPMLLGPQGALQPTAAGMKNAMYMCSFVAVLGTLVTYLLTPSYDSSKLAEEGYLELDIACLRPSDQLINEFNAGLGISNSESEMQQVVHSAHHYALDEEEIQQFRT